ncbi:MAG: hypothetical protein U5L45_15930 [Saprospiraceae bacterium]|nr:hypothetical protein [Saprospiraceae bacterium]
MPYKGLDQAIDLANRGKGSLVSTICSFDPSVCGEYLENAGAFHGRILFFNRESAKESTGHGAPMPLMTHEADRKGRRHRQRNQRRARGVSLFATGSRSRIPHNVVKSD